MKRFLENIWLGVLTFLPLSLIALLIITTFVFTAKAEEPTVVPAPGVQTAAEYQAYLNATFPSVNTNIKTINVSNYIKVLESTDQFKTYDLAVVIDYNVIAADITEVMSNNAYTEQQRSEFKEGFKSYQKTISELTAATFPNKKIRGGFVYSSYRYPNLKMGYHEGTFCGWKNYKYDPERQLNFYKNTTIDKLDWFDFGAAGAPLDNI